MLIADTHVHLYPCYDLARAFAHAMENLTAWGGPGAARVLCLTERWDCHLFRRLAGGEVRVPGFDVRPAGEGAVRVEGPGGALFLVAGRQIVTAERLEVLALTADVDLADGAPIDEVIPRVSAAGAVPVVPWGLGKWLFGRGKVVARLVRAAEPGAVFFADVKLRPTVWPTPRLLRLARRRGVAVLAGSDPLPFPGEESQLGSYAVTCAAELDEAEPVRSLRSVLRHPDPAFRIVGARNGPLETLRRQRANSRARRA